MLTSVASSPHPVGHHVQEPMEQETLDMVIHVKVVPFQRSQRQHPYKVSRNSVHLVKDDPRGPHEDIQHVH